MKTRLRAKVEEIVRYFSCSFQWKRTMEYPKIMFHGNFVEIERGSFVFKTRHVMSSRYVSGTVLCELLGVSRLNFQVLFA